MSQSYNTEKMLQDLFDLSQNKFEFVESFDEELIEEIIMSDPYNEFDEIEELPQMLIHQAD